MWKCDGPEPLAAAPSAAHRTAQHPHSPYALCDVITRFPGQKGGFPSQWHSRWARNLGHVHAIVDSGVLGWQKEKKKKSEPL